MPGGGELTFHIRRATPEEGLTKRFSTAIASSYICISITDTGCGIDSEITERIFEPLFTTKDKTINPGFGLSISYRIIKNHGGFLNFKTSVGEGTTFDIFIPSHQ